MKIRILIVGESGAGKSTVLLLIAKALRLAGFSVRIEDDLDGDLPRVLSTLSKRLAGLTGRTEIVLEEVQSRRTARI